MNTPYKLILFDMDGTLNQTHFITTYADHCGFRQHLETIMNNPRNEPYETSLAVAKLLKNKNSEEMLRIFQTIPTQNHLQTLLDIINEADLKTAIISASYHFLIDDLKTRLKFTYGFANTLILEKGIATGDIKIHNHSKIPYRGRVYSINKGAILNQLCTELSITPKEVIAIGDGPIDRSMLESAGLGVAFNAKPDVQQVAALSTSDLRDIIPYVTGDKHVKTN
jgi:phosphoserine phosphatase